MSRDGTAIGRHISNIFAERELDRNMVCANFAHTTQHGAIEGNGRVPQWETNTLSPVEEAYLETIKALAAETKRKK